MTKAVGKSEYAARLGVSRRTFSAWLNVRYYAELSELGYTKHQKLLMPNQVLFLNEKLCVTEL